MEYNLLIIRIILEHEMIVNDGNIVMFVHVVIHATTDSIIRSLFLFSPNDVMWCSNAKYGTDREIDLEWLNKTELNDVN